MTTRSLNLYCICGSAWNTTTNNAKVLEDLERPWEEMHSGPGHKDCDAATARKERNRRDSSDAEEAT
jgi:hypothetical protein